MSQEDAPAKKTLQVRGDISAERLNAVLEKAGKHGFQLGISMVPVPGAGPGTVADAEPDAAPDAGAEPAEGAEGNEGDEAARRGDGEHAP